MSCYPPDHVNAQRKGKKMKSSGILLLAVLCVGTSSPARSELPQEPYAREAVTLRLIEISPDRSLIIAPNPGKYIRDIHRESQMEFSDRAKTLRLQDVSVIDGWRTVGVGAADHPEIDDVRISILTNKPDVLRQEAVQIFRSLGCVPSYPLGYDAPLLDVVGVAIFDELVFVHNARLGIVALARERESHRYTYVGQSMANRLGMGGITQYRLGESSVYVFIENPEWRNAREWHPTRPFIVVFDNRGQIRFDKRGLLLRVDALHVDDTRIVLDRNTVMLSGPPFPEYSVLSCPNKEAQYSLLDPVSWEPVGLQESLRLEYQGGLLSVESIALRLLGAVELRGTAQACCWFSTITEIMAHDCFGLKRWDRDRARVVCVGTSKAYVSESWNYSVMFWRELSSRLADIPPGLVDIGPELMARLNALKESGNVIGRTANAPPGLGDEVAFAFLDLTSPTSPVPGP